MQKFKKNEVKQGRITEEFNRVTGKKHEEK